MTAQAASLSLSVGRPTGIEGAVLQDGLKRKIAIQATLFFDSTAKRKGSLLRILAAEIAFLQTQA